jgi:hypothetical protein
MLGSNLPVLHLSPDTISPAMIITQPADAHHQGYGFDPMLLHSISKELVNKPLALGSFYL